MGSGWGSGMGSGWAAAHFSEVLAELVNYCLQHGIALPAALLGA